MKQTATRSDEIIKNAPIEPLDRQYYFIELLRDYIDSNPDIRSYSVVTFGCQMNARDSEKLRGILEEIGLSESSEELADIVLYNTCTVRENANEKIYGHLGKMKSLSKDRDIVVGICGCMMQEEDEVEGIKKKYPFVSFIFGTHNIYEFAEVLFNGLTSKKTYVNVHDKADDIVEELPINRKYSFKSGVNISFGCDNFCTYCIVPYVRGRERSRKPEDIISEVKALVSDGVKEIMLLGQNVNSYGKGLDSKEKISFPQLLNEVANIQGVERLRFMTSNPYDLSDELIDVMAENSEIIAPHFHLPLQSGSDKILKAMNRRYTKERYLGLVKKLRDRVKGISITTDIIVGFPGESYEDFLDTVDVVKKAEFDNAFTFIYSKRTGTKAADMDGQVCEEEVKKRFNELLEAVHEMASKRAKLLVGSTEKVLVEGINLRDESLVTGRLGNNTLVHFKGDENMIGTMQIVKIVESKGFYYLGEKVDNQ